MTVEDRLEQNEKLVHFTLHRSFPEVADDEDFQQIGRIALWNACRTYDSRHGEFSTYAVVCIKRTVLKELIRQNRKKRKSAAVSLQAPLDETGSVTLEGALPGDADVCWMDFQGFLEALTDRQRSVVCARLNGLTYREIARNTGVSSQAVQFMMERIKRVARQYI